MYRNCYEDLLAMMHVGLSAVHGRGRVAQWLQEAGLPGPVWAIAIGKAAAAMAAGAQEVLGARLQRGLLITKSGHLTGYDAGLNNFYCCESGHPLPDARSLAAGKKLLAFLREAPTDGQLLFLVSGGASSLVEVLPEEVKFDDLHRANSWLLASGLSIQVINEIRKRLSCIKGGRLIQYLKGRRTVVLMISDVIGDQPASIGSGLLVPDIAVHGLPVDLPNWLQRCVDVVSLPPLAEESRFNNVTSAVIACLKDAQQAVFDYARGLGYKVRLASDYLHGDAQRIGLELARELLQGSAGVRVWGGETTVQLPDNPGRGGRNQSLALAAALELSGQQGVWLLSMGTDGTDGSTEDAGALVDGDTISRGRAKSFDPVRCLASADAGSFLEASGDLIRTGPTGTNVMDLVIGLKR
ncbi:MAG: DUF4147 domain-containing protein [Gammaproteobacteria bacterium]